MICTCRRCGCWMIMVVEGTAGVCVGGKEWKGGFGELFSAFEGVSLCFDWVGAVIFGVVWYLRGLLSYCLGGFFGGCGKYFKLRFLCLEE